MPDSTLVPGAPVIYHLNTHYDCLAVVIAYQGPWVTLRRLDHSRWHLVKVFPESCSSGPVAIAKHVAWRMGVQPAQWATPMEPEGAGVQ